MLYNLALLLPCVVCLMGGVQLLLKRKENSKSQNILAVCLLFTSVSFFIFAHRLSGIADYSTYYKLDILENFISPMVLPLMYLYFRSLTSEKPFDWIDYILFAPSVIIGIGSCVLYLAMGEHNATHHIESLAMHKGLHTPYDSSIYQLHYLLNIKIFNLVVMLQVVTVIIYAIISIVKYHKRLEDFHSNMGDKSIELNNGVLRWFMITLVLAMMYIFRMSLVSGGSSMIVVSLFFVGWAVAYFGLYYCGGKMIYTVDNLAADIEQADALELIEQYNSIDDTENQNDDSVEGNKHTSILEQFAILIEKDEIFLQKNLRVVDVASAMKTNRTYVFKMLRDEYGCSFSEYINKKRVEYAIQIMLKDPCIKRADLADQAGFSSASILCKTFKSITGMTSVEWLKQNFETP